jgi:hypothetical protein
MAIRIHFAFCEKDKYNYATFQAFTAERIYICDRGSPHSVTADSKRFRSSEETNFRLLPAQRNHLSATVPHFQCWLLGKLTTANCDRRQAQRTALSRHASGDKNVPSVTLLFK